MSSVRIDNVSKSFGATEVVSDVSLEIGDGELVALLGPSGSGKTTLLRMIAGFEQPDRGRIWLGSEDVTERSPLARRCGMVFQHYALFPHLSVAGNVGYGLAAQGIDKANRSGRVSQALELVDLAGLENRAVTELSGGQQQRVALARALAPEPRVLLLDEPLSNLDPSLRERTRHELRELVQRIGITTVLVTHEQEEAFDLADRVALLLSGNLAQVDTPENLYGRPASARVARFIGRAVEVPAQVTAMSGQQAKVQALGAELTVTAPTDLQIGPATLVLRPEALTPAPDGVISGTITARRFVGRHDILNVAVGELNVEAEAATASLNVGDEVRLSFTGREAHLFAVTV